jgi:hypothetical protein
MYQYLVGRARKRTLKIRALQVSCLHLKLCRFIYVQIAGLGLMLHISLIILDGVEFVLQNFDFIMLVPCENCTGCHTVKSPFSKSTFLTVGIENC